MSKYDGITRLLRDRSEPVVTIPWDVLDRAVGGLPASARNHRPWWHGDRAQVHAWRAAGYLLDQVQPGRSVTFRRSTLSTVTSPSQLRSTAPAPIARQRRDPSRLSALANLNPADSVVVVPCSKRKPRGGQPRTAHLGDEPAAWPAELLAARETIATVAQRDERFVLPAWQRYTGTFYVHAADALADAARRNAPVLVLSGGYGVAELTEQIGWYERRLHPADWPPGLLGHVIADYTHRRGLRAVVAFLAGVSPYAHVLRSTDWAHLGMEQVVLVTAVSAGGGAQVSVPRDLGLGFGAWYRGQLDSAPDTLRAQPLVSETPSQAPSPPVPGPTDAGTGQPDTSTKADAELAVAHLSDRAGAVPAHALDPREPALRHPGLYAWWADEEALHLLRHCLGEDIGPLIYAGQAGATTRRRAITRAATLKSRIIGQHLRAQTRGSTFALTLASALREPLGLRFAAPRKIDTPSRHALSLWMRAHLAVATYPVPDPTYLARLEDDVLHALDPPLNLDGRAATPVRARLSALRQAVAGTA